VIRANGVAPVNAAWLVDAIRRRQIFTVIPEESGLDPASLAAVVAAPGSGIRCMRIANPLTSPLTLSRIILQIGADQGASAEEEIADAARLLATRTGEEHQVLLIVERAETLDHEALSFLQRLHGLVPSNSPLLQILFVAGPRFWTLLQNEEFALMREQLAGQLQPQSLQAAPIPLLPIAPAPRLQTRRWAALSLVVGVALAGMAGTLLLASSRATVAIDPELKPSTQAAAAPALASPPLETSRPEPSNADAPPTSSVTPPVEEPARSQDQLRRQFDVFLSMSEPKFASLTRVQREELFQQYLLSQNQSRLGTLTPRDVQ
jgi:hypothetical protein